jgi:hypothetical protein
MLARHTRRTVTVDMRALMAALAGLDGFSPVAQRLKATASLHAAAVSQVKHLGTQLDDRDEEIEPRSAAQRYFRIRTASQSGDRTLWHYLRVIADAASDLSDAPIAGSDIHRLGLAIAVVLRRIPGPEHAGQVSSPVDPPVRTRTVEEIWFRRWIIGHQLHAMLNVNAAYALADAGESLRVNDLHGAILSISDAAHIVAGFAASRALALALPATFYQDVLRPTMLPPLTESPLSGRMHVEYRGYRRRLDELLELLPSPSAGLAATQPALAFARERLLEADLIEAERHVTSVEPLVGDSRSLIQTSKSVENAVSVLRRIRHRRAARAAAYVRFPDRMVRAEDDATES